MMVTLLVMGRKQKIRCPKMLADGTCVQPNMRRWGLIGVAPDAQEEVAQRLDALHRAGFTSGEPIGRARCLF